MNSVLETTKFVMDNSNQVSIDRNNIVEFCKTFHHGDIRHWLSAAPFDFSGLTDNEKLHFLVVFNSISFSYWGEPKWTVEYQGEKYDGSWGMITALRRAVEEKKPILDFKYLAEIQKEDFKKILRANVEIPLLAERWEIIKEVGKTVTEKFGGEFSKLVKKTKSDTLKLLNLIIDNFSSFDDSVEYKGKKVYFYKRAQLLIGDINGFFKDGIGNFKNMDKLTACADYKLPQMLRRMGILIYSKELAEKVNNKIPIPKGSEGEIEIRANTIWAIEFMKKEIQEKRDIDIISQEINDHLWLLSQDKSLADKPYHLTRTTAY